MKIALLGYGKMGKTIESLALKKGHEIVERTTRNSGTPNINNCDVAIEFSIPECAVNNIEHCINNGIPVISGTTGWLDDYDKIINLCEKRNGTFLYASNFSVGVNLFFSINEYAAKIMAPWKEYIPEIEEIHHTEKLDSPSGTAISLANQITDLTNQKGWTQTQEKDKLNIISKRINDTIGTHSIHYKNEIDTISLKHEAHSRIGFAKGALLAAEWIANKKGVYTMKDVLQLN